MNRIPSLDGLRGIAILIVVFAHLTPSLPKEITGNLPYQIVSNGTTGVMIFFVISGYLITKLLIKEREKKGNISIKNFYIRRFFRIFPILYIYIITVVVLKNTVAPLLFTDYTTVAYAVLYLWNYKHLLLGPGSHETNGNWYFGHLWSLSMEEQFYLIFPFAFTQIKLHTLKKIIIGIIIAMPFIRVLTYFFMPGSRGQIGMMLQTGGDSILVGCLGAILESSESFMTRIRKLWSYSVLIFASFAFVFVIDTFLTVKFSGSYVITIGMSLKNIAILFLLLWCVHTKSSVSKFLNTKMLMQIGIVSYSIYIWQQLVFGHTYPIAFPLNFLLVFAAGFISYYLIENLF